MLTLRQRIFTIIGLSIGLLAIILLAYFFVFREKSSTPSETVEETGIPEEVRTPPAAGVGAIEPPESAGTQPQQPIAPSATPTERYVRERARIFVERFGSFSNQNDNTHLDDAALLATPKMREWIATQDGGDASLSYRGVITKVIASRIEAMSENAATVHLDVQEERQGEGQRVIEYRSAEIRLVKENNEWWVEGLYWK